MPCEGLFRGDWCGCATAHRPPASPCGEGRQVARARILSAVLTEIGWQGAVAVISWALASDG